MKLEDLLPKIGKIEKNGDVIDKNKFADLIGTRLKTEIPVTKINVPENIPVKGIDNLNPIDNIPVKGIDNPKPLENIKGINKTPENVPNKNTPFNDDTTKMTENQLSTLTSIEKKNIDNNISKINDTITNIETKILKDGTISKNKTIRDWIAKNPGKTLAAAVVAVIGVVNVSMALARFNANNNKKLTIVSMSSDKGTLDNNVQIPYNSMSISSNNVSTVPFNVNLQATQSNVLITFTPDTTLSKNDSIQFETNNMIPSHENDSFEVLDIQTHDRIMINIPDIQQYGTNGTFVLHTTFENNLNQSINDTAKATTSIATDTLKSTANTISDGISVVSDTLQKMFGSTITYAKYTCIVLCIILICFIIYKLISIFKS